LKGILTSADKALEEFCVIRCLGVRFAVSQVLVHLLLNMP